MSTQCSSCKAPIIYLRTERGHWMPVNAESVSPGDTIFKPAVHVTHFSTCNDPEKHRKPR